MNAPASACSLCNGPLASPDAPCPICSVTVTGHGEASASGGGGGPSGIKQVAGYRILSELGSGGMGTVFEAHDDKMNRRVALKVLSHYHGLSEQSSRRFEREAWIAGKLDHPNIVKVYERGAWESLSFYSMELVRGGSLYEVVRDMKRWGRSKQLGLEFGSREYVHWVLAQVIATARGLEFAHRRGVVHRDVKPMNLLWSQELGTVKITDFGLAMEYAGPRMTTEGRALGTLAYMAPEQFLGSTDIGPTTDVYALGVTLFELLTLELPYAGDRQELYMNAVLTSEAKRASTLNARVGHDLETVIRKALDKDPRQRYLTGGALGDDLENVLQLRPINARPPSAVTRVRKWVLRKPVHAALLASLVIGLPTGAFLTYRYVEHRRLVRERAVDELWSEVRGLSQRARHGAAVEAASRLLALDSQHLLGRRARAVAYWQLAMRAEAPGERARLEQATLDDVQRLSEIDRDASWPHRLEAFFLEKFGRGEEAQRAASLAEQKRPAVPAPDDLYFDGLFALERDDPASALAAFTSMTALRTNDPETFASRARAFEALGRYEEAIQDLRFVLALDPFDVKAHTDLGLLLMKIESYEDAAVHLERASQLDPDSAEAHEGLSALYLSHGRALPAEPSAAKAQLLLQADQEARRALELKRESPAALSNLGASLLERSRLSPNPDPARVAEALDSFERAIALSRPGGAAEHPEAFRSALECSCDALIQSGEIGRALMACGDLTRSLPDSAVAHYNLAGAHALNGDVDAAFAALERDFELGDRDWGYLESDAWFEALRSDPRFNRLIERMREP